MSSTFPNTSALQNRSRSQPATQQVFHPPVRVMHVALGTGVGGMEKLLVEFARFTDRGRFELCFASLQKQGKFAEQIIAQQWPVYDFDKRPGLRPSIVLRLAQRMRSCRTQVVHTHNTAAFFYGTAAAKLAGVARIVHTRHGQRYQASGRETWFFRWMSRWVYRVVAVCDDGYQLSLREGIRAECLHTIPNGVDLGSFRSVGWKPWAPAVLVARLSSEKDVGSLIQAIPIVNQLLEPMAAKPPAFTVRIAGDGPERTRLEGLTAQLDVGQQVHFIGHQQNVAQVLSAASMFILPSLTEGISLTLLEAMAGGLPVVATRVGGTSQVVVDGETGFLVAPQSPGELARAIVRLYCDPQLSQRMGQLGRQRVERHFTVGDMVRAYEALYVGAGQS
jgi:glycosyltransferase involved in cell wall biosynthesis